jgi:hypothetical protein
MTTVAQTSHSQSLRDRSIRAQTPLRPDEGAVNSLPGDIALLIAVILLVIGIVSPRFCTIGQMVFTSVLVLLKDPRCLPALMVLQFTPQDFKGGVGAGFEGQIERFEALVIFIFGFPFTPNYMLLVSLFARVMYDLFTSPMRYARRPGLWLLPLWGIAFALSVYNSVLGRFEGYFSWTVPVRLTLSFLALWYGVGLGMNARAMWFALRGRIQWLGVAALALSMFGAFNNRLTWTLLSIVIPLSVIPLVYERGHGFSRARWLSLATLGISVGYALGFRATAAAYEQSVSKGEGALSTLTTILVFGSSLLLSLTIRFLRRPHAAGALRRWAAVTVAYLLFLAIPFAVAPLAMNVEIVNKEYSGTDTIANRIAYKLLWERAALWRGAIDQIQTPPYVFVPAGRPGYMITNSGRLYNWYFGAHNIALHVLQFEGILLGVFSLFFIYIALLAGSYGYTQNPLRSAAVLGVSVITMVFAPGFGGMALAEPATSFFVFTFAGVCLVSSPLPTPPPLAAGLTIDRNPAVFTAT